MRITLNGCCSGFVTEDHRLWHRTMNQAERHGRIAGVIEGALPLYEDPVALVGKIEHHLFYHASHEVADDAINGQAVAGDHDACLSSGDEGAVEAAPLCFAIKL